MSATREGSTPMGKLATYRDKRADLRAHASALKATAKTEAKPAAKEARNKAKESHRVDLAEAKERAKLAGKNADRKAKREAKRARRNDAIDQKAAKRNRKAEAALAKQERATHKKDAKLRAKDRKMADKIAALELEKIKAGKFGKDDVQRWLSVAKVATPVLAPMVYKLVSNAQGPSDKPSGVGAFDAQAAGINATGPGAALGSRIVRLEQTLDQLDSTRGSERQVKEFLTSTRSRLTDLRAAVETAENTPTSRRREVHAAISGELDRINQDILARLGVKA